MDYILVDKLGAEFEKKFGVDPRIGARTRLRLLDGIEKQRKILSANSEATLHLESLMEDEDLHQNYKRADFEEWCMPQILRFEEFLKDAVKNSGKINFPMWV